MNDSDRKWKLVKDAAIFTALSGLLVSVPLVRDAQGSSTESSNSEIVADIEFIDEAFPVVATWNLEQSESYFSDLTLAQSGQAVSDVFQALDSSLGGLETFSQPVAIQNVKEASSFGQDIDELSIYKFEADFENGLAKVEIVLREDDDQKEIYAVNIESI